MQAQKYFITGIGTNVGKTIASAIVTEALQAHYWKPVQAGDLHQTDTHTVKALISNTKTIFYPEAYRLNTPASPHAAAKIDGIEIKLSDFKLPQSPNNLVIEGAGGLMVPLNNTNLVIDLIAQLNVEVILVSQNYLGSINHTLLSIELLKSRNIPVKGIIFNGERVPETENFILNHSGLPCILRIGLEKEITKKTVLKYAKQILYI
ncbi:MAG: dethiobiotin synthase [Sphingobacteriales bacterium]|nr:MAG: dethiobiotin synthase [Sphingobacteriales bacterium]TAF80659.1 MAG: dethiobiotin synthase [Sphingobacteriales bacterium]